jgi:hypothetical protein
VALSITDLSPDQRRRFYEVADAKGVPVSSLLADFGWDGWMPGAIVGTLPHCGLYGLMEPDGRCHT